MANSIGDGGFESLRHLTTTSPPSFLSPSLPLSLSARAASQHLFLSLKPFSPKSPFDRLLIDGLDAEQIWQQIDIQSQPLISSLRRQIRTLEKNPNEIWGFFADVAGNGQKGVADLEFGEVGRAQNEVLGESDDDDVDEGEDDDVEEREREESGGEGVGGVEDKFLKIKELEKYMREDERKEFGLVNKKKNNEKGNSKEDEEDDDDDEEDDDLNLLGADMDDDEEEDKLGNARYEDFYGSTKKIDQKRKPELDDMSEDSDMYGEEDDEKTINSEEEDEKTFDSEEDGEKTIDTQKHNLSTHEKEQQKLRAKIDQMEQANMDPKHWFMQGEVTAAKRPKNSALEVDLDFEHNVRPPPVITEEYTIDIEELIKKRILEGKFDEVQKLPNLQSKAPKEYKEMDENKSGKGLAEIYEDEFVQKTGLVSAALTFSDEQKKEANMLFKKLCLKLDALSHFHFTPKPVVEDMSIQANAPSLIMEEIAPGVVSEASMLAPEEVYAGKGDIKEETELTQAEKKRRRANKKRKYKAETIRITAFKKARDNTKQTPIDGQEES